MAVLSSFEILAQALVPAGLLPPSFPNPFVYQGYWVEISLPKAGGAETFNLLFDETTDFNQGAGKSALAAQIIDANGVVNPYPDFFAANGRGFFNQTIFGGQTLIFGVQCIPKGADLVEAAIPQNGTGWRGLATLDGQAQGSIIATPTQRLLYFNTSGTTTSLSECVYAVPTCSGGTAI